MAKFLANENVPLEAIEQALHSGLDVASVKDISPGAAHDAVLALSLAESRVLVTFDKDFGEMAFQRGKQATCGIILLRPRLRSPQVLTQFLLSVLAQNIAWKGHFVVAREGKMRVVPLPDNPSPS